LSLRQNEWPVGHHSTVTITLQDSPPDGTQLKIAHTNTPQEKQANEDIWERVFWRRLKGFPIMEPLQMVMVYSNSSLEDTFVNLTDSNYMTKALKSPCTIGSQPGKYSLCL
jgi:hypothetical protein